MDYNISIQTKKYLTKFDQILNNMANEMLSQKMTSSITLDFISCMIPHHQAAIYMCENLLNYTNYAPLQNIAKNIIQMQTKGIEQMREIAKTTRCLHNNYYDVLDYWKVFQSITENMICNMRNASRCNNININFTNEMIPHHEGAVRMCNNLLKYPIDRRLANVARTIIMEQSEGIKELEHIRSILCN